MERWEGFLYISQNLGWGGGGMTGPWFPIDPPLNYILQYLSSYTYLLNAYQVTHLQMSHTLHHILIRIINMSIKTEEDKLLFILYISMEGMYKYCM